MCKSLLATNNTSMSQSLGYLTENKHTTDSLTKSRSTIKVNANENTVSLIRVHNLKSRGVKMEMNLIKRGFVDNS